jgi:hypothetical protein
MNDVQAWIEFLEGNASALEILVERHAFRVERLAGATSPPLRLIKDFFKTAKAYLQKEPSFLHWLFLIARREIRFLKTGYLGWDGLFESKPEPVRDSTSDLGSTFKSVMKRQMNSLTDDQLAVLKMKFEDGLWFEETAVQMETIFPNKGQFQPTDPNWLEDWQVFQSALRNHPEVTKPKGHEANRDPVITEGL